MAPPEILFEARSRPQGAQRAVIVVSALAAGVGGFWLTRSLDAAHEPGILAALAIGAGIALSVVVFAMQGARIVVTADRMLTYTLHGRPNLVVAVARITAVRPLAEGLVTGVGLTLDDPTQVRFLHKAGISPDRMRRWRAQYAVDLVLEGFPPEVAHALDRLRS